MKKSYLIIGALVLVALMTMGMYNGLVGMRENVNGKWSQVENQLQRRSDLIPNLVETVKGYAAQEKQIYTSIAEARSKLINAGSVQEKAAANEELSSALSRLLVVVENYPTLKSDANFRQLQDELAGTENRLAVARKDYNDSVQVYNVQIKTFPRSLIASMFGFTPREYFKAEPGAAENPKVKF